MNLIKPVVCFLSFLVFAPWSLAQQHSGLDLEAIDKSANPCVDFYQYACGNWVKTHPIPADESTWGRFDEVFQRSQETLRAILDDAAAHQQRSPLDQKIGAFHESCMNEEAVERLGPAPLQPELERIAAISNQRELLAEIVRLHDRQVPVFFNFSPSPDPNDASKDIADIDQGGLGLPEKDFYFRSDPGSEEIRQKYVAHIAAMLQLAGVAKPEAQQQAAAIMRIETALAKGSLDVTSRRDPKLLVHKMSKGELARLSPNFDFNSYFEGLNAPEFASLNVSVPDFVKSFNAILTGEELAKLKSYLTWHFVSASARLLPKAFVDENFDFFSRTLTGASQIRPRWKRCVAAADDELGEALGQVFVEKTFAAEGKARTLQMVRAIEHQMASDISSLTWMSAPTKKEALVKLNAVTNKIGYPDKWRDYSSVSIAAGDYFGNWYRANQFENRRQVAKIGKPVDRNEWGMTPPTVNAYYNPTENNINFPAGILQPPFYSNQADDAVNFGGVGSVIGHELTHGFDDEGRQYDADGNLKDWWRKHDRDLFVKLADCFVNQYGSYSPGKGLELNGRLTLGENTADNGGLRLAYLALLEELGKQKIAVSKTADGYSEAQQFFLGFGQVWCENQRPEATRLQVQTDPHSPAKFRVDGAVSNMPEFGQAFGCKAGDKMFTVKSCRVW